MCPTSVFTSLRNTLKHTSVVDLFARVCCDPSSEVRISDRSSKGRFDLSPRYERITLQASGKARRRLEQAGKTQPLSHSWVSYSTTQSIHSNAPSTPAYQPSTPSQSPPLPLSASPFHTPDHVLACVSPSGLSSHAQQARSLSSPAQRVS